MSKSGYNPVFLSVLVFAPIACSSPELTSPHDLGLPAIRAEWVFGQSADYSGELQPEVFRFCTSRIAPQGVYFYSVHRFSRKAGDSEATVLMTPGDCTVVNSSKNKGAKSLDDSVRVEYDHTFIAGFPFFGDVFSTLDGAVLINGDCTNECYLPGFPSSITMSGRDGAVSKFYFLPPGFTALGGHGGGGTESFAID